MEQIKKLCHELKTDINYVIENRNDELHINLYNRNIGAEGCKYLEKINCHTLDLRWNNIGAEGVSTNVYKDLEKINCHTIDLRWNNIPNYETIESNIKKRYIERINIITNVLNDFLIN